MNEPVEFCEGIWWFYDGGRWVLRAVGVAFALTLAGCGSGPRVTPVETPVKQAEVHLCPGGVCK